MKRHLEKIPLVQDKIGYIFKDFTLLVTACCYVPSNGSKSRRKERGYDFGWLMESIGDGLLVTIVRQIIYPKLGPRDGPLMASKIVSNDNLRHCGIALGFPEANHAAGRVEAVMGAVWIDSDEQMRLTRAVVVRILALGIYPLV